MNQFISMKKIICLSWCHLRTQLEIILDLLLILSNRSFEDSKYMQSLNSLNLGILQFLFSIKQFASYKYIIYITFNFLLSILYLSAIYLLSICYSFFIYHLSIFYLSSIFLLCICLLCFFFLSSIYLSSIFLLSIWIPEHLFSVWVAKHAPKKGIAQGSHFKGKILFSLKHPFQNTSPGMCYYFEISISYSLVKIFFPFSLNKTFKIFNKLFRFLRK